MSSTLASVPATGDDIVRLASQDIEGSYTAIQTDSRAIQTDKPSENGPYYPGNRAVSLDLQVLNCVGEWGLPCSHFISAQDIADPKSILRRLYGPSAGVLFRV
jgi:hypothetical protein